MAFLETDLSILKKFEEYPGVLVETNSQVEGFIVKLCKANLANCSFPCWRLWHFSEKRLFCLIDSHRLIVFYATAS